MKKLIWLLFLIPIFIVKVNASEVYYSEFSDFSPFQEEKVENSDIVNVIEETRYLWYKNSKILGNYKLYDGSNNLSLEDCYETEYSSWSETLPVNNVGRIYEQRIKYEYIMAERVRYIHLYDLQGSYGAFRIPELMIKVNNNEINYTYECIGCWEDFDKYIHNGIYAENSSYIDNGGSLIIDLGGEYPIDDIEIIFYIFDLGDVDKTYTVGFSKDLYYIYASKSNILKFSDIHWSNSKLINHTIYDLNIPSNYWTTYIMRYTPLDSEYIISTTTTNQYRYKERYCPTYTLYKEYNTYYTKEAIDDYVYKDDSKTKIFYSYQTRDKLEIDVYDITDSNFDLNDFVIYSSSEYEIESNIDFNKNGEYDLVFTLNDIVVNKKVKLDLKENTIKEYENQIKKLQEELNKSKEDYDSQELFYTNKIKELEERISNLNNDLINCEETCEIDKECLNNLIKEKEKLIEEYELNISELSDKVNKLQIELNNKIAEIESLKNINTNQNKEITDLKEFIEKLKKESKELNEKIISDYNKKLEALNNLNEIYIRRISDLEKEIKIFNDKLANIVKEKQTLELTLQEQLDLNNNLKEENNQINQHLKQQIKDNDTLVSKLKNETQEKENLNNKLNSYVLKIESFKFTDIFWFYILILLFIIGVIIYRLRKRSN